MAHAFTLYGVGARIDGYLPQNIRLFGLYRSRNVGLENPLAASRDRGRSQRR